MSMFFLNYVNVHFQCTTLNIWQGMILSIKPSRLIMCFITANNGLINIVFICSTKSFRIKKH